MQFSISWLRSLVNPPLDNAALVHLLTMAGLEVEETRAVAPSFDKVVVAKVLSTEKHPDADKLKLCTVDVGHTEALQIVCGAPNVAPGMLVPCALVGAKLPGIEIKRAKVRGIESFGMLCSAKELGIADDASGLLALPEDAPIGKSVREVLNLDDTLFTLKLTPNRADCLSLSGIAREVAALTGAPLKLPAIAPVAPMHSDQRAVVLDAPDACARYCGRIIRGVNAKAPTPLWMKQRLERCGVRSISAVVDVTNYVMLELGQPLHAFDDARLSGAIHVRYPKTGETVLLLNQQSVTPASDTALIADDARVLALAGVMGGADSAVSDATVDLFLESAFFAPDVIAGRARALGFASDASYRYERGVDFELQRTAIERATQLMLDLCGGKPGPVVETISAARLPQRKPVRLRCAKVAKVLGIALPAADIAQTLTRLGFAHIRETDDFVVTPPSHRFDIEIEEDLIEEVARLHGYDNIPSRPPQGQITMMPLIEARRTPLQLRHQMAERDYQEVINFSFVETVWEEDFCGNSTPVRLANPIASQMDVLRSSLIGSLVGNLSINRRRQVTRVRVFEIGRCFLRDDSGTPVSGFDQPLRLAGLCAGPALPEQWGMPTRLVDFFDVKADVVSLFNGRPLVFEKTDHPALHPGCAAAILLNGSQIGILGELHPRWVQKYELGTVPVVFELDLAAPLKRPITEYREISRFPAVVRDLALIVDQSLPLKSVLDALRAVAPDIVMAIELFDVYHGKGVSEGRKSLAFRVVMQDTQRTLADAEVEDVVASLVLTAQVNFGAELRQ